MVVGIPIEPSLTLYIGLAFGHPHSDAVTISAFSPSRERAYRAQESFQKKFSLEDDQCKMFQTGNGRLPLDIYHWLLSKNVEPNGAKEAVNKVGAALFAITNDLPWPDIILEDGTVKEGNA